MHAALCDLEGHVMAARADEGGLYDEVAAILERHDPMGVMPEEPDPELGSLDEYDPEATTIAARLRSARSLQDVHTIVAEEFARWFEGGDAPAERLTAVAADIWVVMQPGPVGRG
jgi:hypothetical protein